MSSRVTFAKIDLAVKEPSSRCYAIVPAAGRSQRMGRPKLLLPWGDGLMIDQVLRAWTESNVSAVIVVIRQDDDALTEACQKWPVRIIHPASDPPDMKASVQNALQTIAIECKPTDRDRCFVAPADLPTLTSAIINRLIAAVSNDSTIVVPQFGDKLGHPALLPWGMTSQISRLGENQGVNRIVERQPKHAVKFPVVDLVSDVDTLEEYHRLRDERFGQAED